MALSSVGDARPAHPEIKVDFVLSLCEKGMIHILDAVCDDLSPESIVNMRCVCKSWNDILEDCEISNGNARRLKSAKSRKIRRWIQLSKSCDDLLETDLFRKIPLPQDAIVCKVSHSYVFWVKDHTDKHFWVQQLSEGSTPKKFSYEGCDFEFLKPRGGFFTSCDFHLGKVNSKIFISQHLLPNGYLVWNYDTEDWAVILEPLDNTDWKDHYGEYAHQSFVFNSEYLMAILPSQKSGLSASLKLFELSWGDGGQFTGKKLVDQMESSWTIDAFQNSSHGRRLLLIDKRKGKMTMVTFERGCLKKLWEHEDPYFVSDPGYEQNLCVTKTNNIVYFGDQNSYGLFRIDQANSCLIPVAIIQVQGLRSYMSNAEDLLGLFLSVAATTPKRGNVISLIPYEKLVDKEALAISNLESNTIALKTCSRFMPGGCKSCFAVELLQGDAYVER